MDSIQIKNSAPIQHPFASINLFMKQQVRVTGKLITSVTRVPLSINFRSFHFSIKIPINRAWMFHKETRTCHAVMCSGGGVRNFRQQLQVPGLPFERLSFIRQLITPLPPFCNRIHISNFTFPFVEVFRRELQTSPPRGVRQ
jgi:hypothetical protein